MICQEKNKQMFYFLWWQDIETVFYAGTSWGEKRCVCAYDHGWNKQPETRAAKAISNEIIAMYN